MSGIELGMGAVTAVCLIWSRVHHHYANRQAGANSTAQGEPCTDE